MPSARLPSDIIIAARASHTAWDIPASVCLAQWALESAWGTSMPPGSNNPFGIKAIGTQPSVVSLTHEEIEGRLVVVSARFRAFASLPEAFSAHAELLATNSHYAKARLVRHDPDAFARALTGVYATDPRYGDKLIGLMRASALYDYDEPFGPADAVASPGRSAAPPAPTPPVARQTWFDRLFVALTLKKAA